MNYVAQHTSPQSELLQQLERETYQKTVLPQMISGAYQGRLLHLFAKLIQAKNILEVGTFTGYATLCLAEGLADKGTIHSIDINDEFSGIQQKYFDKSGYADKIKTYLGDARNIIPQMDMQFDLVFIDADKKHYPEYFEMILPKMRKNGIILADNVLWYGKVTESQHKDPETSGLKKYNELLRNHPAVDVLILPVRDGISVARVK